MIRPEIHELQSLGPMPREEQATDEQVANYERILLPIEKPVTDEEARVLASIFPPDGTLFGLAWGLLHLIETAPHWPLGDVLESNPENEWIALLRTRVGNSIAQRQDRAIGE